MPLVASNRIGKETIETEHGPSQITFYGTSFIAGITLFDSNTFLFSLLYDSYNMLIKHVDQQHCFL